MKMISYFFTVPACILFYIAEKIRGEKLAWRIEESITSIDATCTKCGHKGKLRVNK